MKSGISQSFLKLEWKCPQATNCKGCMNADANKPSYLLISELPNLLAFMMFQARLQIKPTTSRVGPLDNLNNDDSHL